FDRRVPRSVDVLRTSPPKCQRTKGGCGRLAFYPALQHRCWPALGPHAWCPRSLGACRLAQEGRCLAAILAVLRYPLCRAAAGLRGEGIALAGDHVGDLGGDRDAEAAVAIRPLEEDGVALLGLPVGLDDERLGV